MVSAETGNSSFQCGELIATVQMPAQIDRI
jgi:hypothetical protein